MVIFETVDGRELYEALPLPPALPVEEENQPLDVSVLREVMKRHGLFRTGQRGLYYNRHLLPEPFNTMGRDRLEALTRTRPASRQSMRSIQRHIGAAQRMLDDLRVACVCPALGTPCMDRGTA